jgi:hypothetical protein
LLLCQGIGPTLVFAIDFAHSDYIFFACRIFFFFLRFHIFIRRIFCILKIEVLKINRKKKKTIATLEPQKKTNIYLCDLHVAMI